VNIYADISLAVLKDSVSNALNNGAIRVTGKGVVDVLVIIWPALLGLVSTEGIDERKEVDCSLGSLNTEHLVEQIHGVDAVELVAMQPGNDSH
jgi:hypothetical protein